MEKRVTGEGTKRWGIEGIRVGTSDRFGRGRSEFLSMCFPSAMFRTCEMQVACNVRCSASSAKTPPRLIQAYPNPPYLGLENSPPSPQTTETPPPSPKPRASAQFSKTCEARGSPLSLRNRFRFCRRGEKKQALPNHSEITAQLLTVLQRPQKAQLPNHS